MLVSGFATGINAVGTLNEVTHKSIWAHQCRIRGAVWQKDTPRAVLTLRFTCPHAQLYPAVDNGWRCTTTHAEILCACQSEARQNPIVSGTTNSVERTIMANSSSQPNGHKHEAALSGEAAPPAGSAQAAVRRDILPIPDVSTWV